MKNLIHIFLIVIAPSVFFSQSPVLSEEVDLNKELPKYGQNRTYYGHFYVSIGTEIGKSEGNLMEVNSFKSIYYDVGYRYKVRLLEYNAIGFQLNYNYYSYRLKYSSGVGLPIIVHDKDKIKISSFGLGIYDRINYGRRGNHLGKFIDIGAYGEFSFSRTHYFKQKQENGEMLKSELSRLNSVEKLNYGVLLNMGFNKIVIFGKYRLSDMISDRDKYDEMPRLVIGLQYGF